MTKFLFKHIDEMTGREFFCVERLRTDTFVTEQKITLPEEDDLDLKAVQVYCLNAKQTTALATCRIFPIAADKWQLGRVAVAKNMRRQGLASQMMAAVHAYLRQKQVKYLSCHAQIQAKKFYLNLGYQPQGSIFQEGGVDHVQMTIKL
jgi:ElaA protein